MTIAGRRWWPDDSRCLVAPSPELRERQAAALEVVRASADESIARFITSREPRHPGFNDGLIIPGRELPVGASLAAARSQAADRARGVLVTAAEALFQRSAAPRPPAGMVADHIWALSHGVVELFGRGKPGGRSPISAEDMLESGALIYLRGLGVIPD